MDALSLAKVKSLFILTLIQRDDGQKCRKRSIPTHSERLNPPTIIAKMALKSA